jgi:hypothetical protein
VPDDALSIGLLRPRKCVALDGLGRDWTLSNRDSRTWICPCFAAIMSGVHPQRGSRELMARGCLSSSSSAP